MNKSAIILLVLIFTSLLIISLNTRTEASQPATTTSSSDTLNRQTMQPDLLKTEDNTKKDTANPWKLNLHNLDEIKRLVATNEDSMELLVGVDTQKQRTTTIKEQISKENAKIKDTITTSSNVQMFRVIVPINQAYAFAQKLLSNKWVKYVEPNYKVQVDLTPNDPSWTRQWGPKIIQADYTWNTTLGSSDVLVAVIDTGIDYTHSDLAANYVPLGYDWVNNDTDPKDDHGHGTHCAGIIGAVTNNHVGIAGLAQVKLMAEKVLDNTGYGTEADVAEGIIDATNKGAKIISMSFGGPDAQVMHDALKYAYDHGVLLVASAGNAGDDIKHYPAAYDEVIAVTATDLSDNLASFSSFGDWVEVAAPGVGIYSTVLSNSYREMSGTSMACPHVSGVAGLVWSAFPNYTNRQVRQLLRYSADDLGNWGFDVYYGYGRVNARRAVIGVPAHDLGLISRDYPNRIDPGQLATFNTTLANFGKNDEADITVELLVNGTVADAKTIDFMEAGVYASVSLQWGTTIVGAYNVTYYVVPVAGEDYVTNNFVSVNVSVRFPTILKVPDEYSTIKLALNSAGDGDTVLVNEGNYNESSIEILTDSITLMANGTVILDNLHLRDALNIRADNVVVSGFTIKNVDLDHCGIRMKGHNNSITNNTVIGTLDIYPMTGILAYNSTNCNISGNSIIGAFNGGVILTYSSNNTITQNKVTFSNWEFGIVLSNSSYNNVTFNTVTKCTYNGGGIHIVNSNWNFIASNNLNESRTGIILEFSGQNVLRNNNMTNNEANFGFASPEIQPLECLLNDIGTSNTVNGKPICYWINVSNAVVPENTGYVALIRCDNITVQNLTLKNNMQGVLMLLTNNTLITHNIITENNDEILFPSAVNARYCFNIVVNENELTNNKYGIMLNDCSNGTINMNNMTNGAFSGAYLMYSTNITLSRNDISSTYQCLEMYGSSNNLIIANNMTGGSYYTLAFSSSSENVFSSNNIVNAGVLIVMWESENRWDDGYPTGGNFWSNYAGADFYRGPHQNETGSDGIGDAPFTIDQNNTDAYPLKKPYRGPYDVGITTIAALKNQAYQNKSLNVTINIINYGVGDENLNIIIYAWPYPIAVFGGILSARNSGSFSFRCNLTGVPCGRYALKAVVSAVAGETDTSDNSVVGNTVTITILGDVNGDLVVNISDATQLSLYWQQLAPPAPVNVDINGDGVVDIRDATLIGVNWQKHA